MGETLKRLMTAISFMGKEDMMFRREHFPVRSDYWGSPPNLPPFHPSIAESGLDPGLVVSILGEAVSGAREDFSGIGDRYAKVLDVMTEWEVIQEENGTLVAPFPTSASQLFIEKRKISPYGGDHYICIREDRNPGFIAIHGDVPEGLKREYELLGEKRMPSGAALFTCQNLWSYHNVYPTDRVLYKNIVIALDNAIVNKINPD